MSNLWLALRSITWAVLLPGLFATGSRGLLIYWVIWFDAVNLFVMGYEEPNLRARFGESYERYS